MTTEALMGKARNLLSMARSALHYERALTKASGESFNVFNILRIAHYEVRTHSPILAELLNPKGSHGQGAVFLKDFCSTVGIRDFDAESGWVRLESHIGRQTTDEGGRIDILVADRNGSQLIIENKIYALEQPNQLKRYKNYSPKAHLLFLTLFGEASEDRGMCSSADAKNISYSSDVLRWLEQCRKEAANAPIVRETIAQYIHLVKQLTQQNTNTRMSQQLTAAVLQDEATYLAYTELCKTKQTIQVTILTKLKHHLEPVSVAFGLTLDFSAADMTNRYGAFHFTSPRLDEQKVKISFQFGQENLGGCIFGFSRLSRGSVCPMEEKLFTAFKNSFTGAKRSPDWWVVLASWDLHSQWDETTMAAIQFGTFHNELQEVLRKLVAVFDQATHLPVRED